MACVYLHKNNKDNCKVYVGKTIGKAENRWASGKGYLRKAKDDSEQGWHYTQPKMAEAVLNSNWDKDWDHKILEDLGDCTQEELNAREAYWIDYFDATNPLYGYNIMHNAEGPGVHSEESKIKMSKAHTGKKLSKEHCDSISKSLKGKKKTKEHIEKVRQANIGKHNYTEEQRKAMSEKLKGRYMSEEAIKKSGDAHKKPIVNIEYNISFESLKDAELLANNYGFSNVKAYALSQYLHGRHSFCGKDINGNKLHWKFIDNIKEKDYE